MYRRNMPKALVLLLPEPILNFINLRDAGDPVKNAEFYQAEGADELAMLDIAAGRGIPVLGV
jgi:hypothetical protein